MSLDSEVAPRPAPEVLEAPRPAADPGRTSILPADLSRRGFLRGAALTGGGIVAATIAACAPAAATPGWTYSPPTSQAPTGSSPAPTTAASAAASAPAASGSPAPSATAAANIPPGWTSHDVDARNVVRRYIGNLAPALKGIYGDSVFAYLADMLAVSDNYPELGVKPAFAQVPNLVLTDAVTPLQPTVTGGVKEFRLTIDEFNQKIDELLPPVAALGYNKQWPGPTIRVNEGDRVRAIFTNNLKETTSVHFHGVEFDDFTQDGVAFVTQKPFAPGESHTYEFTASRPGSLMYHSHHNATDQVGRGLLGAFLVDPKVEAVKADREYTWISNDALGGFTVNGHGFPATVPVLVASGETILIRFMNEGVMTHPWHLHGYRMRIVARDGYPLGSAAFDCDTLGVNPGERYDALITADRPGLWAFHCHILPHAEGLSGMFGMVNTLMVVPKKEHVDAIVQAILA
jgi:FtsP/CotA-like multicopper oxidase with cupredoxin domain